MTPLNLKLGVIFAFTILVRVVFHYLTGFIADDAFITFRYAENIASGLGFVYNEGQRVLGTTTPLFALLLSALALIKIPPPSAALLISLISSGLTACMLFRFAISLRFTTWSIVPVVVYALWPRSLPADTGGMETALFTLLITAGFYFQHKKLDYYAMGMATLATVTRPEGTLLLLLLVLVNWWQRKDQWLSYIIIPLVIIGPWLVFEWYYFGAIIPNSAAGKLALYSRFGTMSLIDTVIFLMGWHTIGGWLITIAAVFGGIWLNRKQNFGWLEIIWMLSMLVFFAASGARMFFWYIVPIYPVLILFATAMLPWLAEKLSISPARLPQVRNVVVVLGGLLLIAGCYKPMAYYKDFQQAMDQMHRSIGLYLAQQGHRDDLVAAEDVGYMGYYSEMRILDRDGLVSPEAIPYNRSGDYFGLIRDYSPEWVVAAPSSPTSGFVADSAFVSLYEPRKNFPYGDLGYTVYARRAGEAGESITGQD